MATCKLYNSPGPKIEQYWSLLPSGFGYRIPQFFLLLGFFLQCWLHLLLTHNEFFPDVSIQVSKNQQVFLMRHSPILSASSCKSNYSYELSCCIYFLCSTAVLMCHFAISLSEQTLALFMSSTEKDFSIGYQHAAMSRSVENTTLEHVIVSIYWK